ncbi:TPA: hypothetical protein ACJTDP_001821 [Yersinia enterocolitica]
MDLTTKHLSLFTCTIVVIPTPGFPSVPLLPEVRYVRFEINKIVASFHRPHPDKEAKAYQVRDAKTFLEAVGVVP